ncbi:dihydrofolate reductase [Roseateles sp. DAIF2]|uniref:dihydrofolate reductase family protein n=1 Tax=Roseateles sp. DAIF2 TaxID=2714952 RepID=UPI0018A305FB|nr:dihydrofolate reductase family protein [Roseateles sp. DAIF2]QPF75655.1 dihydrofolate reductase [Roseateles sp. DAIF2]
MRKIIAALQVSLDGYIEGPEGELDWVASWEDSFDLLSRIDTCILGRGMYPSYEQYWSQILADPEAVHPFTGRRPSPGERLYARFAEHAPHLLLSRSLRQVAWSNTRILRDLEALRAEKAKPGKDMHALGGASLINALLNAGLVDELRLMVNPVLLGRGKALFGALRARHALRLREGRALDAGRVLLAYDC